MKTSVNVMGIQAIGMLERMGTTLKAVMRAGNKQQTAIVVEGTESELCLFMTSDPVFCEDRLLTEIPEPNWEEGLLVHPGVLVDRGDMGQTSIVQVSANRQIKPMRRVRKGFRNTERKQISPMNANQADSNPAKEQREVKSSLSPPVPTLT